MTSPRLLAALLAAAALAVAGCSTPEAAADPDDALAAAKTALDEAGSVRISLTGEDLPSTGTVVVEASGTAGHPPAFDGTVRITRDGLPISVDVVSVDGVVYAQLPLTDSFTQVDPDQLGVDDPAGLMDPDTGVSNLLVSGSGTRALGQVRVDGEVLDEYETQLPGSLVGSLLTIADPSAKVTARIAVEPDTDRPRRAVLTGPFFEGGDSRYVLTIDEYGDDAGISAPTG